MDGTSTDATYVVDPAVGASTALSGTPERARHTPTWTATPTLRSGVSQSPTSPSSNGDSSTHHRVRPKFTINPRLWGSSTSSKVSKAMKLRSVANPHWTDALCQPDFKLPSRVQVPDPPPSFHCDYVLPEIAPISPLRVPFPLDDNKSISGVPTSVQDGINHSHSHLYNHPCQHPMYAHESPQLPFPNPQRRLFTSHRKGRYQSRHEMTTRKLTARSHRKLRQQGRHKTRRKLIACRKVTPICLTPPCIMIRETRRCPDGSSTRSKTGSPKHSHRVIDRPRYSPNSASTLHSLHNERLCSLRMDTHHRSVIISFRSISITRTWDVSSHHGPQSSLQPHQGFNISQSAQQEGMSSAEGQGPVESDNNIKSVTAWHLIDIRSNFPPDLTGRVVREGQEPFSSGSFGDIFRGTLRMGGRSIYVAVKAIRTYTDDDGDDAKRGQRFRREITTWLKLDHNNVLPLFGTTMNFGRFPAMVCPWLENGSLTSYLERPDRNITTPARLFLVSGVAAGLQYLHSQSVVHGDLSGSNVLVDGNGRACISDFGLSTLLTQLGRSTFATSHQHLGTLRWTAPELLELSEPDGEDELPQIIPSPRSDVYSFGRIILQILTRKVPYHYWTREAQVMRAISRGVIPQRPRQELVTDHQWLFMQRCWAPVDAGELRPCVEEIVEFVREELVNIAKA